MGLDYTEMLLACEERFGISIDGRERPIRTVGDLHSFILQDLEQTRGTRCLKPKAFFRLRRSLMQHTGRTRSELRPETPLRDILPHRRRRRRIWKEIRSETQLSLPALSSWLPESILFLLCLLIGLPLGVAVAVAGMWTAVASISTSPNALLEGTLVVAGAAAVFVVPCLVAVTLPVISAWHIPRTWTLDSLLDAALGARQIIAPPEGGIWDAATVWRELHGIIATKLDVKPEAVTPDADFFDDLGAG